MKPKLAALALGLALIAAAFYFQKPAAQPAAEAEESLESAPARKPIPRQDNGMFQTASFHPSSLSVESSRGGVPILDSIEAEAHWNTITNLVSCATTQKDCPADLPDNDPSAKFFALRDQMLDELDWYLTHKSSSPAQSRQIIQAAHYMLAMPDEQLQAASLKMLKNEPASPKTVDLITQNMEDVVDSDMIPDIAELLGRSMTSENEQQVVDYVCKVVTNGSTFASRAMAKNFQPVLRDATRSRLESCMGKLEPSERQHSMRDVLYPSTATI